MQQQTVTLGIRGFKLANKDIFSKSDPYIVISKPVSSGGYTPIRTSETIKVKHVLYFFSCKSIEIKFLTQLTKIGLKNIVL